MQTLTVKNVSDTTIDVFTGKGWNNWSRFDVAYVKGKLLLKLIKGSPMAKEDFHQLYKDLT